MTYTPSESVSVGGAESGWRTELRSQAPGELDRTEGKKLTRYLLNNKTQMMVQREEGTTADEQEAKS